MLSVAILTLASTFFASVSAHGHIDHVTANGKTGKGYNPYGGDNSKAVTREPFKNEGTGAYLLPPQWNDASKMSCEGSTASGVSNTLTVSPGGSMTINWQGATGELDGKSGIGAVDGSYHAWVHAMGTVSDFITSCNGKCADFDATNAGWVRLSGDGLDTSRSISDGLRTTMTNKPEKYYPEGKGVWGMADFLAGGSKRTVTIPTLKAGEYLVRSELVAVHNPLKSGDSTTGPQLYAGCVQITVSDGGSLSLPSGTKASEFYQTNGDFAKYNPYSGSASSFKLAGPEVWNWKSSSGSSTTSSSSTAKASSTSSASSGSQANANANATTTSSASSSQATSSRKCKAGRRRSLNKMSRVHKKRLVQDSF